MDRFLMQYINNKCALILHESVKNVVLDFRRPESTPLSVLDWETNWPMISLGTSPPKLNR